MLVLELIGCGVSLPGLHVEAEIHHIAIAHDIGLALDAQLAGFLRTLL